MTRITYVVLLAVFLLFGCNAPLGQSDEHPYDSSGLSGPQGADGSFADEAGVDSSPVPSDDPGSAGGDDETLSGLYPDTNEGKKVLLMGRSVAYHWTEYMGLEWTCDDEECATGSPRGSYGDVLFIYYELSYPPDIATSAAHGVDLYGRDADVVFFKFCFVDFASDDSLQNARDNIDLAEDVYQYVVVQRHKKLIFGNALPQVSAHTDGALLANQREFNDWLDDFASTHDDIQVLDLNGLLSDSQGNLKAGYAVASDDSHLNSAGYGVITPELMALIEEA